MPSGLGRVPVGSGKAAGPRPSHDLGHPVLGCLSAPSFERRNANRMSETWLSRIGTAILVPGSLQQESAALSFFALIF
jgi:hypothetical protein